MAVETPVKALLVVFTDDAAAAVYVINRLRPEHLCFFLPDRAKTLVESAVQPQVTQMPRRWDWVVTPEPDRLMPSYQTLTRALGDILRAWEVRSGELVVDVTGATPAMAGAAVLASVGSSSRVISLGHAPEGTSEDAEVVEVGGTRRVWLQGNPWDEAAGEARREACELFNRGAFVAAATRLRQLELRVSGGQKPLYRALADLAEGYGLWDRFQYRQAWDKLKTATKALDMASLWGGPPGLKGALAAIKPNTAFLEKLVLDPQEVKEAVALDLLAHARRRAQVDHHTEAAMAVLIRGMEACAQHALFAQYRIKSWDVQPEQLPQALREPCQHCFLDDVDGKYKLPLYAQFRALAGLGHRMGQAYLAQWAGMKPLLDAAGHAVLGHGFEPVKAERFQQLYETVLKVTGIQDQQLPKFPILTL